MFSDGTPAPVKSGPANGRDSGTESQGIRLGRYQAASPRTPLIGSSRTNGTHACGEVGAGGRSRLASKAIGGQTDWTRPDDLHADASGSSSRDDLWLDAPSERVRRLGEDQARRAEHLGSVAERAGGDADGGRRPGPRRGARSPPSSGRAATSPAAARSPPTTTSSGLRALTSIDSARPTASPASATARCAPRSPASTSSSSRCTETGLPRLRSSIAATATGLAIGLQAAAVAAAADQPVGLHEDVADLAGDAATRPGTGWPSRMRPAPMPAERRM